MSYRNSLDDDDDADEVEIVEEEEDDYGCYFLRPVNEYKISEKIVEANRELFGDNFDPLQPTSLANVLPNQPLAPLPEKFSRVSFRSHLEDFEPEFITDTEDEEEENDEQDYSESESDVAETEAVNSPGRNTETKTIAEQRDKINMMLDSPNRRKPSTTTMTENNARSTELKVPSPATVETTSSIPSTSSVSDETDENDTNYTHKDDDEDIDEICEVIGDFGLANSNDMLSSALPPMALTTGQDESDDQDLHSITSDYHQSGDSQMCAFTHNRKISPTTSAGSKADALVQSAEQSSSQRIRRKSTTSQQPPPARATSTKIADHPQHLKIQLNFKPCCEFKNAEARRLPTYCGYVSQYGLSKVQLEHRDARRETYREQRVRRVANREVEESSKSRVNEEAFARWLTVKMRTARSTIASRNMYDCAAKKMVCAGGKRVPAPSKKNK